MKYIKNDVELTLLNLEQNMKETSAVAERYQKELIYQLLKRKHTQQYIDHQRRILALKSPLSTTMRALKNILGMEQKVQQPEEDIDTSILEAEFQNTREVLNTLTYTQVTDYYADALRHGLKHANNKRIKAAEKTTVT